MFLTFLISLLCKHKKNIQNLIFLCFFTLSSCATFRILALKNITDQNILADIALNDNNKNVRLAAVRRITDQNILKNIVLKTANMSVRDVALNKITDQNILYEIAVNTTSISLSLSAVRKITDQNMLKNIVLETKYRLLSDIVLNKITDQNILYEIAVNTTSIDLSLSAVRKITDQNMLKNIVLKTKYRVVRDIALNKITDQSILSEIALKTTDISLALSVIKKITDQELLIKIALESNKSESKWELLRDAFRELDKDSLNKIIKLAKDPAIILAAKICLGKTNWEKAFNDVSKGKIKLSDVIGATALVDEPSPQAEDVVNLCHLYIRKGLTKRIPELCELLMRYGNKELAEDYLNCGEPSGRLYKAAEEWARKNGYFIFPSFHKPRVIWGSERR